MFTKDMMIWLITKQVHGWFITKNK